MKNITDKLPKQPVAKLIIDGLFILCVNEKTRTAEIGIYEYANEHNFSIRVSLKDHNAKSVLLEDGILVRKLDDKHEIKEGNIAIAISGRPNDVLCYQHALVKPEMLTRSPKDDPNTEPEFRDQGYDRDFRWIIDLESSRFHGRKLDLVPGVIKRKISLSHGTLCTEKWLSRIVSPAYEKAAEMSGRSVSPIYYFVANQAAFAIENLLKGKGDEPGETIDSSYVEDGTPKTLSLSRPDKGVYYEILISNNCPSSAKRKKERQSDFQCYYNVINMPIPERLEMLNIHGAGDIRVPCDLIFLGQTSELP